MARAAVFLLVLGVACAVAAQQGCPITVAGASSLDYSQMASACASALPLQQRCTVRG